MYTCSDTYVNGKIPLYTQFACFVSFTNILHISAITTLQSSSYITHKDVQHKFIRVHSVGMSIVMYASTFKKVYFHFTKVRKKIPI